MARHLTEKYVQRKAVEWLEAHLKARDDIEQTASQIEATLKKSPALPGHGRADGLVAGLKRDGTIYSISLEAKSRRTLHNLRTFLSARGCVAVLLVAITAMGAAFWLWHALEPSWVRLVASPVAFVIALAGMVVGIEGVMPHVLWDADVVQQSLRYPASERWIAISSGARRKLGDTHRHSLRARCRKLGVGLLVVNRRGNVEVLQATATRQQPPKGVDDFLDCYCCGDELRQRLAACSAGCVRTNS